MKTDNLRLTKKRKLVLNVLKKSNIPLTSEEVYEKIGCKNIDLSTVYRTLSFFNEKSIIEKSLIDGNKIYYSIKNSTHEHCLICKKCKKKILFDLCPIKEMEDAINKNTGFKITSHLLEFEGLCENCQS